MFKEAGKYDYKPKKMITEREPQMTSILELVDKIAKIAIINML